MGDVVNFNGRSETSNDNVLQNIAVSMVNHVAEAIQNAGDKLESFNLNTGGGSVKITVFSCPKTTFDELKDYQTHYAVPEAFTLAHFIPHLIHGSNLVNPEDAMNATLTLCGILTELSTMETEEDPIHLIWEDRYDIYFKNSNGYTSGLRLHMKLED